jgi:hypothetical protein
MGDSSLPEDPERKIDVGATIYGFLFDFGLLAQDWLSCNHWPV